MIMEPLGPYMSRLHLVSFGNIMCRGSSPGKYIWIEKIFIDREKYFLTEQPDLSQLVGDELDAIVDEVPPEVPLHEHDVQDEVDQVHEVTQHQLARPRPVAAIEILKNICSQAKKYFVDFLLAPGGRCECLPVYRL